MPHEADIIIIGAGVVGLAVAAQVAREDRDVYVLEKNETFGLETRGLFTPACIIRKDR